MKNIFTSIRGKLLFYFFVFILLFNIVSVSIYISSSRLMDEYNTSFERFLIFNAVSQQADALYEDTNAYVRDPSRENLNAYYTGRAELREQASRLEQSRTAKGGIQDSNYRNLIDSLIENSEITVGFVLQDDIERYTTYLQETRNTASYIQENTLKLIDRELTEYQQFYADLQQRNEAFGIFTMFLFLTTVMIAVFFAFWFAAGLNRPLQQLSEAAAEVSGGNFEGDAVRIQSNDEMKLLGDTFNQMREDISTYVEEMKEKAEMDRLMKELELKHLQNQMNPHFLFNTLNTVSKMAYLEEADLTSQLMESVSVLLRYNLGNMDKAVTLQEEVNAVESYFHIQETRFQGRVSFQLDMEQDVLPVRVPRLFLQPLVENAFIHGVEPLEEGGTITVRIYDEAEQAVVEVVDDGIGMTEHQMQHMFDPDKPEEDHVGHSTGLGLVNVRRRLQLFYQTEKVMDITSVQNSGTCIRLFLPKQGPLSGKEEQDERNDC
ncbi:sensor histidine kinase [Salibacterium halotolerans]|uniref:histidine kinase n=1 Tax=Salibacterium halotolerans TaxID=1884432 RepID=A0A1I5LJ14_9BACI|nr:histidine kinase [Salibacterium halotolerans]SFO97308.1 Histidine kinase-, DNA gyrase B-, and HSP90-like ATPase [Salibacterium halotolerans]